MAEFKNIVITTKGQALISKMLAGTGNVQFTKMSVSDTTYTDRQLEALTSLTGVKQSTPFARITRENNVSVKLEAAITNENLQAGYYARTVGIYANDPNDGEILYAVMIAKTAGWMPPYNGLSASSMKFNMVITVGNAENVSVILPSGATPTMSDIEDLQDQINELESYIGYSDVDIYGVEVDFQNKKFTRLAGAENLNGGTDFDGIIPFKRRRCIVTNEGKVIAYQGEAGYVETGSLTQSITIDSGANAGTYAVGTKVQVMVEQPKFYYKVVPLKLEPISDGYGFHLRKARYYISETKKPGFKIHPKFELKDHTELNAIYLSAFDGCAYDTSKTSYILNDSQDVDFTNDILSSISGAKPMSGLTQQMTRTNARKIASNRGTGWGISNVGTVSITQMLFLIEYASFNIQSTIGNGATQKTDDTTTNMAEPTGATTNLGNKTGTVVDGNGVQHVSYRGEENPFGNIYYWVDGMNIDRSASSDPQKHDLYVALDSYNDTSITDSYERVGFKLPITNGYISAFGYDEKFDWLFMTSEVKGDSSLPVGDYFARHETANSIVAARLGGSWNNASNAGLFYCSLAYAASSRYRHIGARLVYVPTSIH